MKKIAIFSATKFEMEPLRRFLETNWAQPEAGFFQKNEVVVELLVSGVGPISTAFFMANYLTINALDAAWNVGVAGSFEKNRTLGEVVQVVQERFGDLGAEEADGRFSDLFDLKLLTENEPPFSGRVLKNLTASGFDFLPKVNGLTVSRVHGSERSIAQILEKYPNSQVETMEGAAFFQACLTAQIPFLEIRSLSNFVEKRNRAAWQMGLAIENLNQVLIEMLDSIS